MRAPASKQQQWSHQAEGGELVSPGEASRAGESTGSAELEVQWEAQVVELHGGWHVVGIPGLEGRAGAQRAATLHLTPFPGRRGLVVQPRGVSVHGGAGAAAGAAGGGEAGCVCRRRPDGTLTLTNQVNATTITVHNITVLAIMLTLVLLAMQRLLW